MKRLAKYAEQGRIDERADITDRQSIIINAPIEMVWDKLTDVKHWPDWNEHINETSVSDENKAFSWNYDGRKFDSTFTKMDQPFSLAWLSKSGWIKSVFAWTLDKTDEKQTVITVEECYDGFLLFLFMNHNKAHSNLLNWLDQLKQVAEECEE